ncbi:ATPase involved in DNA replication HolB, large subunit [Halanaeroarchaeum sp. HSR-CO]|uniref:replication factor C large subunit n=1 Tax=Halanaeroarchaeum sp. HSR-CO TaxID=2866382 RepID=UPI00217D3267|nr:replication factor C large subunit [Halanaeroarchaeum sp. HSR-CO]UWG48578.1 ATPase involved in DNA replication HolB, large subunit [Halanaeroarchaeum sp. HSR-CO]
MVDWTEKYRPTSLSEVRGNDSARDEFEEWARTWAEHRESVVLHGSPGVGKTSAAHALAADMDWDVIELNASDQRTADVIERVAGEAAKSGTLAGGTTGRKLVVLDEADNLHGNVDRGGAGAITRLVKESDQPIVLIANDFYDMSRGLRNATREIEFRDVSKRSILPVLRDICRREGIEYEDSALDALAAKNAGDLRSAINDLQALAEQTAVLTEEDVVTGSRDTTEGIFDFLDAVLKEEDAEGALKLSYDVDETPDDLIHWVEDNVPKDYDGAELARAYRYLTTADRWLGRVRATQEYAYWRYVTDNVAAGVAAARDGTKGGWTRYGPPSYWRKLGRSRGARDTRDYVARAIAETSGVSMSTARREVVPFLGVMTHHCKNRELTVAMTAAYDLDETHVSFVTGSGEDTNKVQSIVEDAEALREEAAVEHSGSAFEGATAAEGADIDIEADGDEVEADTDTGTETEEDEKAQSGLDDFF